VNLERKIERLVGAQVLECDPLAGGDLSSVTRARLAGGRTIVAKSGPLVEAEARMLRALAARGIPVPAVIAAEPGLLLMAHLPAGGALSGPAWQDLAAILNQLAAAPEAAYGWREDYAFGPVAIANPLMDDWPDFWAEHRLRCHLPHLPSRLGQRVERLAATIGERLPGHPPAALLHGDVWGGNVLVADGRISGLIDPACYRGDREVDVAMPTLFDHPPACFFDALDLAPGWRDRLPVYRLWPLLVHVRLFGGGYLASAERELDRLGA